MFIIAKIRQSRVNKYFNLVNNIAASQLPHPMFTILSKVCVFRLRACFYHCHSYVHSCTLTHTHVYIQYLDPSLSPLHRSQHQLLGAMAWTLTLDK